MHDDVSPVSMQQAPNVVTNNIIDYIAYDGNWYHAASDLNEDDYAHYQRELEIWKISKGKIPIPDSTGFTPAISQHLLP